MRIHQHSKTKSINLEYFDMKILLPLLLLLSTFAQASQTTYTFFESKLSIDLPTELKQLSPSALNKRYGSQKRPPTYAFSNKEKNVSFTFTRYLTPANKQSMRKNHKLLSNMLRAANPKASWKKDKIYTRLGTKIAVYEYEIKGKSNIKYQYNLTFALPINGQLTFITFVTTQKKYKKKWLELARHSMDSIQLF